MTQLQFVFDVQRGVTCAFGTPWPHSDGKCEGCESYRDELDRQFEADVVAGKYNARGYTRSEWKRSGRDVSAWEAA